MKNITAGILLSVCAIALSGCASIRYQGAGQPASITNTVETELSKTDIITITLNYLASRNIEVESIFVDAGYIQTKPISNIPSRYLSCGRFFNTFTGESTEGGFSSKSATLKIIISESEIDYPNVTIHLNGSFTGYESDGVTMLAISGACYSTGELESEIIEALTRAY